MKSDVENPQSDPTRKAASQTANRSGMVIAVGMLIFCILVAVALVFVSRDPLNISLSKMPSETDVETPISITPEKIGGVTVVEKMPERETASSDTSKAPVSQGAAAANGFAIDLGSANSYRALSQRFADLVELNDTPQLKKLEPRGLLTETDSGLQARLLVGPFANLAAAQSACSSFRLPEGSKCDPGRFEGELISREP